MKKSKKGHIPARNIVTSTLTNVVINCLSDLFYLYIWNYISLFAALISVTVFFFTNSISTPVHFLVESTELQQINYDDVYLEESLKGCHIKQGKQKSKEGSNNELRTDNPPFCTAIIPKCLITYS